MKIAFITTHDLSEYFYAKSEPLFTHDDFALVEYLRSKGHEVNPVPWGSDLDQVRCEKYNYFIVRSPWDYMKPGKAGPFFNWLKDLNQIKGSLLNPFSALQWNYDKKYLLDLKNWGINVVPTELISAKAPLSREILKDRLKQGPYVLKPTISAGAKDTYLLRNESDVQEMRSIYGPMKKDFSEWRANREFLIQPYIDSITSIGEWSLVYLNGFFSHAVHKLPKTGGWLVQDELGGSVFSDKPSNRMIQFAQSSYETIEAHFEEPIMYARIDIVEYRKELMIGEIELIEPELFFLTRPQAGKPIPNLAACDLVLQYLLKHSGQD